MPLRLLGSKNSNIITQPSQQTLSNQSTHLTPTTAAAVARHEGMRSSIPKSFLSHLYYLVSIGRYIYSICNTRGRELMSAEN
jgi:hypothetical protein